MSDTIGYYEKNAETFINGTKDVELCENWDKFEACLPKGGYILDLGCGSGRDAKHFLEKGFRVDAVDGSKKICEIAEKNTGIRVRQMMFDELDEEDLYDGIWACSSILHLPKEELGSVIKKMLKALKAEGRIYTSFKYGEFGGERNGRYFTDFTEASFDEFLNDIDGVEISGEWITSDARPGRDEEKWLNLILQKENNGRR
ncbi:MAG: class I SAM-dependent methyltransferase [Lachnospiraceae bacterium]|nr:class I SAM-dependent methyltransferase [Lachnospiraceae bacterium]